MVGAVGRAPGEGCRTDRTDISEVTRTHPVQIALNCGTYKFVALGGVTGLGATVSHAIPSVSHDKLPSLCSPDGWHGHRWATKSAWGRWVRFSRFEDDSFRPHTGVISHGQRSQVPTTGVHGLGPRRERASRRPSQAARPAPAHRYHGTAAAPSGSARRGRALLQLLHGLA